MNDIEKIEQLISERRKRYEELSNDIVTANHDIDVISKIQNEQFDVAKDFADIIVEFIKLTAGVDKELKWSEKVDEAMMDKLELEIKDDYFQQADDPERVIGVVYDSEAEWAYLILKYYGWASIEFGPMIHKDEDLSTNHHENFYYSYNANLFEYSKVLIDAIKLSI